MSGVALAPIPHAEGIALLKGKPAVVRSVFDQLLPELKGLAFTITGIEAVDVLQRSRDIIAGLPQGRDWEQVKADLLGEISPWIISGDDEEERAASARGAARRAELLMRLHGFNAYEVAHSRVMEEMEDVFSHWRWQTMGDSKVRPSHAAMDGITLPRDSPFWRTTWPRRGYLCRCQLIGITPEEAEEELAADRLLPAEQRKYLEGSQLAQLEQGGIINRGLNKQYNLAKEAATGPHRQFGSLRIDPEELKSRYDPDVWREFESFAKRQEVEPGKTVWGWLSEMAPAAVPASTAATASAAAASATATGAVASVAAGTPVAAAIDATGLVKSQQALVAEVMDAIGQVHGDGVLPLTPVDHKAGASLGLFTSSSLRGDRISYRRGDVGKKRNIHPHMTLAHEVGHWLDRRAFPGPGFSSAAADPLLNDWWNAVDASTHVAELRNAAHGSPGWRKYASKRLELWARAYAQYIAIESGNPTMLQQLRIAQSLRYNGEFASQWADDDFEPIRESITRLFEGLGWRQPHPTPPTP